MADQTLYSTDKKSKKDSIFHDAGEKRTNPKRTIFFILLLLALLASTPFVWYFAASRPVGKPGQVAQVEIPLGSGVVTIAGSLEDAGAIRSRLAFRIYCKLSSQGQFQAGNYDIPLQAGFSQICELLKTGKVHSEHNIKITFVEGKNIRWLANRIARETSNTAESVLELMADSEYIDSLIAQHWFLTGEIKNPDIYYPLEGYLFADTYSFEDGDVGIEEIFDSLLKQTGKILEPYRAQIEASPQGAHGILTMASIIECESIHDEDRKNVASVFYNRLARSMSLGSDVTTYYAAKVEIGERDLKQSELNRQNPYNTRGPGMEGKLPVGPISSSGRSSIIAALEPANTDNLFFVADKNGKLYFSKTNAEHSKIIRDLKDQGLWYEFE